MADTYAGLLDALGFNAADAAKAQGQTQRDLESTQATIRLTGEDERASLKASAEQRGVLTSGEYVNDVARQRADEASRLSMADTAAADRLSAIQRELQRSSAQRQLQNEERDAARRIQDEQYQLQRSLLSNQAAELQQSLAATQQQQATAGLDIAGLMRVLYPEPEPSPAGAEEAWRRARSKVRGWWS